MILTLIVHRFTLLRVLLLVLTVCGLFCGCNPLAEHSDQKQDDAIGDRSFDGILSADRFDLPGTTNELLLLLPVGMSEREVVEKLGPPFAEIPTGSGSKTLYYEYGTPVATRNPREYVSGISVMLREGRVAMSTLSYTIVGDTLGVGGSQVPLGERDVMFEPLPARGEKYRARARVWVEVPNNSLSGRAQVRLELSGEDAAKVNKQLRIGEVEGVLLSIGNVTLGRFTLFGPFPGKAVINTTNTIGIRKLLEQAVEERSESAPE